MVRLISIWNNDKIFSVMITSCVSVIIIFVVSRYLKWKFMYMRIDSSVVINVIVSVCVRFVFMFGSMNLICFIVVFWLVDSLIIFRIWLFNIWSSVSFSVGGIWIMMLWLLLKFCSIGFLKSVFCNVLCIMLILVGFLSVISIIVLSVKFSF